MLNPHLTLNCAGRIISLEEPLVMGIINVNPDSFYAASRATVEAEVLRLAEQMITEGAAILDVGGMSSRPGAGLIDEEEELRRVIPALRAIRRAFPDVILSVDTIRAETARRSVEAGASIINDISAGRFDSDLYATVGTLGTPYVLMHMQGTPATMQKDPCYEDVVREVLDFFIRETNRLQELGVRDIILDPGFGFGKTVEHNYLLLKNLHVFSMLDYPLLVGISRKSMINRVLDCRPEEALNGSSALHMAALQQGGRILRVHDVKPAVEVIKLWQQLEKV